MSFLSVPEKLQQLRALMHTQNMTAYIVLSADPHMSEYLPEYWKMRQWLSGFTGSVGTLVITQDFAGLWVDGRYWVQAEQQLKNTGITLQKLTQDPSSNHLAWLENNIAAKQSVCVNGQTISVAQFQALEQLAKQADFQINTQLDLISQIWQDQPALPSKAIYIMDDEINALSRKEKIEIIREKLNEKSVSSHFISALDDIAWILNSRGQDVDYNPVFLAHLFINQEQVVLFIDQQKLDTEVRKQFHDDGIQIKDYQDTALYLMQISEQSLLLDPSKVSIFHEQSISKQSQIVHDINPSSLLKSRKQDSEIAHIRHAMQKDGVALCHFFHWLENALANQESISELTIDEKITGFRQQQQGFIGLSFSTIAGFNENGALPHYRATPEHYSQITGNGLLLIDSGAQYSDGTTDITRVIPIGQPSQDQKRDYTLVLKCHIALAQAVFPEGIAAQLLDSICRQPLWQHGLDYRHGTGHGVGFALNVHEGPQVLSYYAPIHAYSKMHKGMIVSNEPGLYHEGKYGIRIENLVVNRTKQFDDGTDSVSSNYGEFLEFETLTLCPINRECIVPEMLDQSEKAWLNQYHATVRERLSPSLSGEVLEWLIHNTEAVI